MTKWAAVIGDPISHSLSPVLHRTAFDILGLDWEYGRHQVRATEVADFVREVGSQCVGLSVTAPLKRAVLPLVDAVDGMAKLVGAGNTLVFSEPLTAAFNTDVQGIVDTVKPLLQTQAAAVRNNLFLVPESGSGPLTGQPAPVILGTGATACSAVAAVKSLGATSVILVGRSFAGPDNAFAVANSVGLDVHTLLWKLVYRAEETLQRTPLIISTVPPTATEDFAQFISPQPGAAVLDVTYARGSTPLEHTFRNSGGAVGSPLAMLTHQGIAQVKLWTNEDVPFAPIYEAVQAAATQ